jgi:hypothetical protein
VPTLPDIKSKVTLNTDSLTQASKTSAVAHAQMQEHAKTSTTHTLRFDQSLTTLMDHLGGMPPVVNEAGRGLESMASTGVTGMNLLAGAGLVAAGVVAEVIGGSIKSYTELGDKVENYRRVVGGSAEESGRMVQTFAALGVGADTATSAMFKLSKAVETTPKKLTDLGVVVAHDAAGNVDLSKTLLSVADAYNATASQTQKNLIVFDAFGKSGKDLIPILEQGSAGLAQLEKNVALTFTDADLQRIREAKVQEAELQQQFDALGQNLGQTFLPIKEAVITSLNREMQAEKLMDQAMADGTLTAQRRAQGGGLLLASYEKQVDASNKVKYAIDLQTQALQDQAAAEEKVWTEVDKVLTQDEAQINAGFALKLANLAVTESQAKVNQAQEAYTLAVKTYGASSDEALLAAGNLTQVQTDQEKSYYATAAAARALAEDTEKAAGGTNYARLGAQAYIDELTAEAATLSPGNPLRKNLQDLIDKLTKEMPRDVFTSIHLQTIETRLSAPSGSIGGYAEGGRPPVGPVFTVGEKGPELMRLDSPATVYPHGQGAGGGGADMSEVVTELQQSNSLTRQLLELVANPPQYEQQTGDLAAIDKMVRMADLNRLRGSAGA